MAKDGTNRGGVRIGAGRKPKSLEARVLEGNTILSPEKIKENQTFKPPSPKTYITAQQKDGTQTCARQVYRETYAWLQKCGCAEMVSPQLVENFAQTTARYVQTESEISRTGFLTRQPATGEPIPNPLIKISLDYLKAANQLWYQINQFVKENGIDGGADEVADTMELILRRTRQVKP